MPFTYTYPRAALTVDCVVFGLEEGALRVLLIQRASPPFQGCWALPGGFVEMDETVEQAAVRELQEETGVHLPLASVRQVQTFSAVQRDPRERVISVAHQALVHVSDHPPKAASDARAVRWHPVAKLPKLAFDHATVLRAAMQSLRLQLRTEPLDPALLPKKFTVSQLRAVYEAALGCAVNPRRLRSQMLALDLIKPAAEPHHYTFNRARVQLLQKEGCLLEL